MFDARDGFAVLPLGDARPIPDIFGGGGIELMVLLVEDLSDGKYRQREGGSYRLALGVCWLWGLVKITTE